MVAEIKKLSRLPGRFRDTVQMMESCWRSDPGAFEGMLAESTRDWSSYDRIPLALHMLLTEVDDRNLRNVVRRVCESEGVKDGTKQDLYFVAALWNDERAREWHLEYLKRVVDKAIRSRKDKLVEVLWAQMCGAMLKQYNSREDLERYSLHLEQRGARKSEYSGMVEALLELQSNGAEGLAIRLESAVRAEKVSDTDVNACFLLGTTGDRTYIELLSKAFQDLKRDDWWTKSLRCWALLGHAWATVLGEPTLRVIAERLVEKRQKLASWWSGGPYTAELIAISAILWNSAVPLNHEVIDVLLCTAEGAYRENAKFAMALLMLKGINLPPRPRLAPDDQELAYARDFLQYDTTLNFSYYWRCKHLGANP